jgi:hypothetical protein
MHEMITSVRNDESYKLFQRASRIWRAEALRGGERRLSPALGIADFTPLNAADKMPAARNAGWKPAFRRNALTRYFHYI